MKTRLVVLAILLASAPVHAQLYKWVDKDGKVHYSDTPPPEKAKTEQTLNISNQPGAAPAAGDDAKTWQEREQEFQKRRKSEAEASAKKQKEEHEAKTRRENCEKAKNNLSQLQSNAPVYTFSEASGRTYLNEKQRADAIEKAKKSVSDWCK